MFPLRQSQNHSPNALLLNHSFKLLDRIDHAERLSKFALRDGQTNSLLTPINGKNLHETNSNPKGSGETNPSRFPLKWNKWLIVGSKEGKRKALFFMKSACRSSKQLLPVFRKLHHHILPKSFQLLQQLHIPDVLEGEAAWFLAS
jgi:hypothetical protein